MSNRIWLTSRLGAGVVRNTGRAVKSIRLGDHVVLSYASCGDCRSCVTRKPYQCYTAQQQNFGGRRADRSSTIQGIIEDDHSPVSSQQVGCLMFGQSSFSSTTIARECSCVPVDKHLPLETICALGCGFQTGSGAVYNLVKPLQRAIRHVAIFGIGGVGCAAILAANQLRETAKANFSIVAIDIHGNRLELARELGATETINSSTDDLVARVQTITKGEGFDAAIDCTGVIPVVKNMVSVVGVGGIAVQVGGPPPGKTVPIDAFDMLIKCKSYVGCHQGNAYSKEVRFIVRSIRHLEVLTYTVHPLARRFVLEGALSSGEAAEKVCC